MRYDKVRQLQKDIDALQNLIRMGGIFRSAFEKRIKEIYPEGVANKIIREVKLDKNFSNKAERIMNNSKERTDYILRKPSTFLDTMP